MNHNIFLIKCKYKEKYYKKIINEYDEKYIKLMNILNNIPYNHKKIRKHFPINIYNTFDEYLKKYNKLNNCNVSFSILYGDFELQKKIIIDTIDRRYNTIKIFDNNLKNSILENYLRYYLYGIKVMDLMNFKDDIIYLNTPESILRKYPNFKTNDNDKKCMYEYVFIIRTENIHHYIDLKNNNMCDNILICGDNNKYNIMFQSNNLNKYINSSKNTINKYINFCFNNKILKI